VRAANGAAGSPRVDATPAERARAAVAADGLAAQTGAQLATSQQYQDRIGIGSGTVRKAIRELDQVGALRIRTRGHLGTVITDRHPGLLWQFSGRQQLRIGATPPGAPDQRGLMQGLVEQCDELGIPHSSQFYRGARRRLQVLLQGKCDLITLSAEAADGMAPAQRHRVEVLHVSQLRYYDLDLLVLVSNEGAHRARKVGIDRDSRDHVALTEIAFADHKVELVDCHFHLIPRSVLTGEIDGGLWHRQYSLIPPELAGLKVEALSPEVRSAIPESVLSLALAWRREDVGMTGVVRDLDGDAISRVQRAAIRHSLTEENDDPQWI